MAIGPRGVESSEDQVVAAAGRGKAQPLHILNANLRRRRLRFEELHYFNDKLTEGHGAGIVSAVHQVGGHVRRNEFYDLDLRSPKLVAERLGIGMNGCLGRAVGRRQRQRNKGQSRGDIDDGGARLLLKMRQQRGGQPNGSE